VVGIEDDRAKGFALGVASHAIGTARAFQISEVAGAFASLGMILNALLTIVLVPMVFAVAVS
jgi:putative effector of murein hydrolase